MIERPETGGHRAETPALAAIALLIALGVVTHGHAAEADLVGTAWLAEDIDGGGVVDGARPTIEFSEPGRVAGLAGCNRYFGPVTLNGDAISIGNLATTRMMCPDALMDQDQRFMEALSKAERLALDDQRQILLIYAEDDELLLRFGKFVEK